MAPFHTVVLLRRGQGIALTRGAEFQSTPKPECVRGAQRIRIKACTAADAAGAPAAIAEVHGHRLISVARYNPYRRAYGPVLQAQFYHGLIVQPEALRGSWTEQGGVVPGGLGNGFGEFLQPAIVSK